MEAEDRPLKRPKIEVDTTAFDFCSKDSIVPQEVQDCIFSNINWGADIRVAASVSKAWNLKVRNTFISKLHLYGANKVHHWVNNDHRVEHPDRMQLLRPETNLKHNMFDQLCVYRGGSVFASQMAHILGNCAHHVRIVEVDFTYHVDLVEYTVSQVVASSLLPLATFSNLVKLQVSNICIVNQPIGFSFPLLYELRLSDFVVDGGDYDILNSIFSNAPRLSRLYLSTPASFLDLTSNTLRSALITKTHSIYPFRNQYLKLCAPRMKLLMLGDVGEVTLTDLNELRTLVEEDPCGPISVVWENASGKAPPNCAMLFSTALSEDYDMDEDYHVNGRLRPGY